MLNYVKYQIKDGHIEVIGGDDTEIGLSLKGKVELYSKIEVDNISYNVRSIAACAFPKFTSLKEIFIPNSVIEIRQAAFEGCSSLEKVNLPKNITNIYIHTFDGCSSLKEIKIPSSVKEIGQFAFLGCSSLTYVDIPEGVTSISEAFANCSNLVAISMPSSLKIFNSDYEKHKYYVKYLYCKGITPPIFKYTEKVSFTEGNIILFVPEKSCAAYEKASGWNSTVFDIRGVDPETFNFEEFLKENGVL